MHYEEVYNTQEPKEKRDEIKPASMIFAASLGISVFISDKFAIKNASLHLKYFFSVKVISYFDNYAQCDV